MSNQYKFYSFQDSLHTAPDGITRKMVRSLFNDFTVDADQPLRAFNEFRKAHTYFDFVLENSKNLYVRHGIQFYAVTFEGVKERYLQFNPGVDFTITESNFNQALGIL